MSATPKPLPEMDVSERYAMMSTVTEALSDAAEHALNEGEERHCENFKAMAAMLADGRADLSSNNLGSLELMLRQAIMLLQLYMERTDRSRSLH